MTPPRPPEPGRPVLRRLPGDLAPRLPARRAAIGGGAAVTAAYGSVATQTAYAAGAAQQVLVVLSMRGAADGLSLVVPHADPVYYRGPAVHRGPVGPAPGQGRHVRPAPDAGAAAAAVERRQGRRRPRHRSAGRQPLALLRHGGGRGRRPGSRRPHRLAQPARRPRRHRLADRGHPDAAAACRAPRCAGPRPCWSTGGVDASSSPAASTRPSAAAAPALARHRLGRGHRRPGRRHPLGPRRRRRLRARAGVVADPGERRGLPGHRPRPGAARRRAHDPRRRRRRDHHRRPRLVGPPHLGRHARQRQPAEHGRPTSPARSRRSSPTSARSPRRSPW